MSDFINVYTLSEWACLAQVADLGIHHSEWLTLTEPVVLTKEEIAAVMNGLPKRDNEFADLYALALLGRHEAQLELLGADDYKAACEKEGLHFTLLDRDFQSKARAYALCEFDELLTSWADWLKTSRIEIHVLREPGGIAVGVKEFY